MSWDDYAKGKLDLETILKEMKKHANDGVDVEIAHSEADDLLFGALMRIALDIRKTDPAKSKIIGKICYTYDRVPKWYA
jgi:hypothetical protein